MHRIPTGPINQPAPSSFTVRYRNALQDLADRALREPAGSDEAAGQLQTIIATVATLVDEGRQGELYCAMQAGFPELFLNRAG